MNSEDSHDMEEWQFVVDWNSPGLAWRLLNLDTFLRLHVIQPLIKIWSVRFQPSALSEW